MSSSYKTEFGYRLMSNEAKSLAYFIEQHKTVCDKDITIEYSTASGIGRNTWVKCSCGQEKDITDYGAW